MSRGDAVVLASRTLAMLMLVWTFADLSYLPEELYSFRRYLSGEAGASLYVEHMRHYYLILIAFRLLRAIGFLLMAMWLRKCGPEVMEMLLPLDQRDDVPSNIR